jgi:hypothetical protein
MILITLLKERSFPSWAATIPPGPLGTRAPENFSAASSAEGRRSLREPGDLRGDRRKGLENFENRAREGKPEGRERERDRESRDRKR